jgi:hypothetical protein
MTDLERIEKVNRMQKIGAVIWKPTLVPYVELKVEKDGEVLTHVNKLCESFNRNFFVLFALVHARCAGVGATFGDGILTCKTTGASITTAGPAEYGLTMTSSAGGVTYGIILGTSTTTESFNHFAIQTIIPNGSAAGTLAYQAQALPSYTWTGGTLTWEIDHVRVFNNNSGGIITVNEIALYYLNTSGIMVLRDLLAVGVDVPNTAQLTVTYHMQMVFPE